jgi:hypothetical protein
MLSLMKTRTTKWVAAALLSLPFHLASAQTSYDPVQLEQLFSTASIASSEIAALVKEAEARAGVTSLKPLLAQIHTCTNSGFEAGRVNQEIEQRYYLISRDIDEPSEVEAELKKFYTARVASQAGADAANEQIWIFAPDSITVKVTGKKSEICLKSPLATEDALFYLAHEFVHYARSDRANEIKDSLSYKDYNDYAWQTVLSAGDEVDAYKMEYGLRIQRLTKRSLSNYPELMVIFNDQGVLTGTREALAHFILTTLQYTERRFHGEYKTLVNAQTQVEEQRLKLAEDVLKNRLEQAAYYQDFLEGRNKVVGAVWGKYKAETERAQKLLEKTLSSKERLKKEVVDRRDRLVKYHSQSSK